MFKYWGKYIPAFCLAAIGFHFETAQAQTDTCLFTIEKHSIKSEFLGEEREFWVSLPMRYDSTEQYPTIYVLDAEWRFDLIRPIAYDMSGNKRIPRHIIVGIPHIDWEKQRGIDLTFSQSRIEYDGEAVDSTWYNDTNSGSAMTFFDYLSKEVVEKVNKTYPTNGENVLVGHSYGGYFGGYLLSLDHPFTAIQSYDPSIWYGDGEVIDKIKNRSKKSSEVNVFVAYQTEPKFHLSKIEEFIGELSKDKSITLGHKVYPEETHNSLFMYSFIDGMKFLYPKE